MTSRKEDTITLTNNSLKTVFSDWKYVLLASIIAAGFWILFAVLEGLLFFSPIISFWIPFDARLNFIISNILAAMIGITMSMNVYLLTHTRRISKKNKSLTPWVSASSILAVTSSACISCSSSLGILIVTTLGGSLGVAFSSFMLENQIPIRLITLGLLLWTFVSSSAAINKRITGTRGCNVTNKQQQQQQ
jgi:hypothetical protein